MVTPTQAQRMTQQKLAAAGIQSAAWESRLLTEFVLGLSHPTLILPELPMTEEDFSRLKQLAQRRCERFPLQYLLGTWEFFGLEFVVEEGVLIPRQDTEILVETVLELRQNAKETRLLDLCSGSGCIPAAITSHLRNVTGDVLELSEQAMPCLRKNLHRHAPQFTIWQGDVLSPPEALKQKRYDIITCNPPYLTGMDMGSLQEEVRYEPEMALYGGEDGLTFYRRLTPLWKPGLAKGGWLVYEVGVGQAQDVQAILEENDFTDCCIVKDLAGIQRVVLGRT